MQMDQTPAAHNLQRTTALLETIINFAASVGSWVDSAVMWPCRALLRRALRQRHARAVIIRNYQDHMLVVAIGRAEADAFKRFFSKVTIGELGLVFSTKDETNKPFGTAADFIGATFHVSTPARPYLILCLGALTNFRRMCTRFRRR